MRSTAANISAKRNRDLSDVGEPTQKQHKADHWTLVLRTPARADDSVSQHSRSLLTRLVVLKSRHVDRDTTMLVARSVATVATNAHTTEARGSATSMHSG